MPCDVQVPSSVLSSGSSDVAQGLVHGARRLLSRVIFTPPHGPMHGSLEPGGMGHGLASETLQVSVYLLMLLSYRKTPLFSHTFARRSIERWVNCREEWP